MLIIFFLVYSQIEFNITTTKNGDVSKYVGETVTLQWNITKEINSDQLTRADLILLNPERVLYNLFLGRDQPVSNMAKEIFGERISASISKVSEDKNVYQLTLQNLKYNESGLFQLQAGITRGQNQRTKTATIKLLVTGMVNIIFFLMQKGRGKALVCYLFCKQMEINIYL